VVRRESREQRTSKFYAMRFSTNPFGVTTANFLVFHVFLLFAMNF
jgi:hypothetical protein